MKGCQSVVWLVVCFIVVNISSAATLKDTPTLHKVDSEETVDIELTPAGFLVGTIHKSDLKNAAKSSIRVSGLGERNRTCSVSNGKYRIGPLRGGLYTLQFGGNLHFVRLWKHDTAPPNAVAEFNLIEKQIVRGQSIASSVLLSDNFLFTAAIVGAIATPVITTHGTSETLPSSS